jgi:CheY-like chemotaxis protein
LASAESKLELSSPGTPPAAVGAAAPPADDPDPSGVRLRRRLRILVADDEPLVGAALRRALAAHEVTVVSGGVAALAAIQEHEPEEAFDLVLCDVTMPDLSGPGVYQALSETNPAVLPRFVFLTGGVLHEGSRRFLAALPNRVLRKPFDLRAIRELVTARADAA